MRSIGLKVRQALVLALLLSFSAMQVVAMSVMPIGMDPDPMSAAQHLGSGDHPHASLVLMPQMEELHDMSHSTDMCGQDCIADHCLMGSAITVTGFTIELSGSASEIASVDVSAESIDTYPPYYPPISH
jgi:hypothetical protein